MHGASDVWPAAGPLVLCAGAPQLREQSCGCRCRLPVLRLHRRLQLSAIFACVSELLLSLLLTKVWLHPCSTLACSTCALGEALPGQHRHCLAAFACTGCRCSSGRSLPERPATFQPASHSTGTALSATRRRVAIPPVSYPATAPACSMPLFLWNFESKQLHGIFKAASDGEQGSVIAMVGAGRPWCMH